MRVNIRICGVTEEEMEANDACAWWCGADASRRVKTVGRMGELKEQHVGETPSPDKKRQRLESSSGKREAGVTSARETKPAQKMLPFVSPERPPRGRVQPESVLQSKRHQHALMRSPLQVRAAGRQPRSSSAPSPVQDHMTLTRKKVRASISAQKTDALRQLERQYLALREKIVAEIREAEEQLQELHKVNESINDKAERKLQALTELAASEIIKIEKARAAAMSSTAQLYAKEKQKVLQRFDAEIDALTV